MISEELKQKLTTKLVEEKEELEEEVKKLKVVPEFGSDRVDEEEESEAQAYNDQLALAMTYKKRLADIETALQKLEEGNYGICESCGKDISEAVLLASSESRLCQDCKKKEAHQH